MSRESRRVTVVELHEMGIKTGDIVRTAGFKQMTAYRIVKAARRLAEPRTVPVAAAPPHTPTTP